MDGGLPTTSETYNDYLEDALNAPRGWSSDPQKGPVGLTLAGDKLECEVANSCREVCQSAKNNAMANGGDR